MNETFNLNKELLIRQEIAKNEVNGAILYILWAFLGLLGIHHIYLWYKTKEKLYILTAFFMLITFGGAGVYWFFEIGINMFYIKNANEVIGKRVREELGRYQET